MITLPKQNNYQLAMQQAWQRLALRPPAEIESLGAPPVAAHSRRWDLPVLGARFEIDLDRRYIDVAGAAPPGPMWSILALHYLLAAVPVPPPARQISFEQIPDGRNYSGPYNGRVVRLFCATVGRSRESFLAAAAALGARTVNCGDAAVELPVFPRVPLTIVWYAGDDELPPGASFLYNDNLPSVLDVEDIIVMAERAVSRLRGKPW